VSSNSVICDSIFQDRGEEEEDVYWYVEELVQQLEHDKQRLNTLESTEHRHTQRYTDLGLVEL
jgi:hypothetical protein